METSLNYTSSETENYVKSFTTNDSNLVVKKHYIKYIFFDKKHVESFIYDLVNKPDYYEIIEKNENSVVIMNDTYDTTFTIDLNKFILERTKIQYIESDKIKEKKKEYVNFPIGKFNFITEDLKEKFAYINQKLYLKEKNKLYFNTKKAFDNHIINIMAYDHLMKNDYKKDIIEISDYNNIIRYYANIKDKWIEQVTYKEMNESFNLIHFVYIIPLLSILCGYLTYYFFEQRY
jgi:hypothetical protein